MTIVVRPLTQEEVDRAFAIKDQIIREATPVTPTGSKQFVYFAAFDGTTRSPTGEKTSATRSATPSTGPSSRSTSTTSRWPST